jgi:hypothetical protein
MDNVTVAGAGAFTVSALSYLTRYLPLVGIERSITHRTVLPSAPITTGLLGTTLLILILPFRPTLYISEFVPKLNFKQVKKDDKGKANADPNQFC